MLAGSGETHRYSSMEPGHERLPPSILGAALPWACRCAHGVPGASVLFWSSNPCKGSSRLSHRGADGTVRGGGTGGTSSISSLPAGCISSPEQGCILPHRCKRSSEEDGVLPPSFVGVVPIYRGFDGSFPPPFFHDLGWFCEWAIVTGSGRGKGADGEQARPRHGPVAQALSDAARC